MEARVEQLWHHLRRLKDPFSGRDLVSLGCIRDLRLTRGVATVVLVPLSDDRYRNDALQDAICRELGRIAGVDSVVVIPVAAEDGHADFRPRTSSIRPLPVIEPSAVGAAGGPPVGLGRADLAPEAGYGPEGPPPLPAPELDPALGLRYEGWPPVFQWEIDPHDPSRPSGEAHVTLGDWEYDIWWQTHPAELVYASIQALHDDLGGGPERPHPIGRNVAVNLIYDQRRGGVVGVYGTARDFRPFIEAFRIGFNLQPADRSRS